MHIVSNISSGNLATNPVVILSTCHGHGYGAERVLEYLLANIDDKYRRHLVVVAPSDSGVFDTSKTLNYRTLNWPTRNHCTFVGNFKAYLKIRKQISDLNPRIVHAWHGRNFEWAFLLGGSKGCSGTLHDHPASPGLSLSRKWIFKNASDRFRFVVAVSDALAASCRHHYWKAPCKVIKNGLPFIPIPPHQHSNNNRFNIAFLGCNERWKGAERVFELIKSPLSSPYNWNFYGDIKSSSLDGLAGLIERAGSNVSYFGRMPVDKILSNNDIVLHPSINFDPFPTVLLEAARSGVPSICSDVGGSSEIVEHSKTGFVFSRFDVNEIFSFMQTLLCNKSLYSRFSELSRNRYIEHFQAETMAAKYLKAWNIL